MGRMHSRGKGISASALPYKRTPPSWLKVSPQDPNNDLGVRDRLIGLGQPETLPGEGAIERRIRFVQLMLRLDEDKAESSSERFKQEVISHTKGYQKRGVGTSKSPQLKKPGLGMKSQNLKRPQRNFGQQKQGSNIKVKTAQRGRPNHFDKILALNWKASFRIGYMTRDDYVLRYSGHLQGNNLLNIHALYYNHPAGGKSRRGKIHNGHNLTPGRVRDLLSTAKLIVARDRDFGRRVQADFRDLLKKYNADISWETIQVDSPQQWTTTVREVFQRPIESYLIHAPAGVEFESYTNLALDLYDGVKQNPNPQQCFRDSGLYPADENVNENFCVNEDGELIHSFPARSLGEAFPPPLTRPIFIYTSLKHIQGQTITNAITGRVVPSYFDVTHPPAHAINQTEQWSKETISVLSELEFSYDSLDNPISKDIPDRAPRVSAVITSRDRRNVGLLTW